jgi:predicted component of type VI protein secretion system
MRTKACATAKLALCLALLELVAACSSAPPLSPTLLARCTKMHRLWMKYEAAENPSFHPQRKTVDLALYRCQTGRYDEGIPPLEKTLRRDLIPLPP